MVFLILDAKEGKDHDQNQTDRTRKGLSGKVQWPVIIREPPMPPHMAQMRMKIMLVQLPPSKKLIPLVIPLRKWTTCEVELKGRRIIPK